MGAANAEEGVFFRPGAGIDGGRRGNIEVMLAADDGEGKPVNLVVTGGEFILKPAVYKSLLTVGLQMHKEIDLPRQAEYLRTGICDLDSDAAGTLDFPCEPQPIRRGLEAAGEMAGLQRKDEENRERS
jgi:hypothetical protein